MTTGHRRPRGGERYRSGEAVTYPAQIGALAAEHLQRELTELDSVSNRRPGDYTEQVLVALIRARTELDRAIEQAAIAAVTDQGQSQRRVAQWASISPSALKKWLASATGGRPGRPDDD